MTPRSAAKYVFLAVVLAIVLMPGASRADNILHRGNRFDPASIDPHKYNTLYEQTVILDLFEGLVTVAPDGTPAPGLAHSWTVSPDGKTWTFTLRPGLQWSDGTPLTADDVVYSFRRLMDPKTAATFASIAYLIENATAVNTGKMPAERLGVSSPLPDIVVLTLETPATFLPELLGNGFMAVVPRHAIEKFGDAWLKPENSVTNGPFILKEWIPNSHIAVVRNPRFRDAAQVKLDGVMLYPTEDGDAAVLQYRAGGLDTVHQVPSTKIDQLRRDVPGQMRITPALLTYYLALNLRRPKLADLRVRRAISLAIDRDIMTNRVLRAGQIGTETFVPPAMPGYRSPMVPEVPMTQRIEQAKQLMAQSGYSPDKPLRLTISTSTTREARRMSVAIGAMLKPIGVEIAIHGSEGKVFFSDLRVGDFDIGIVGWGADYADAATFLTVMTVDATSNYSRYTNPAYDALLDKAAAMTDAVARAAVLQEAEVLMLADQPIVPLYVDASRNLVAPRVKGWVDNVADTHLSRYLSVDQGTAPPQ